MKIIIINKEKFQNRPPVISTLLILSDLGYELQLITVEINDYWIEELSKRNVDIDVIPDLTNRNGILKKVFEYTRFKRKVKKTLSTIKDVQNTLLWVIGGNTIWCLDKLLLNYRYILQIQELHEKDNLYLRSFKEIVPQAEAVFMNEYNRTVLYQCWFNLQTRPIVISNKLYFAPNKKQLEELSIKYNDYIDIFKKKKVILYQGIFGPDRDISNFILAVKQLGEEYCTVLVGRDYGMVDKYKNLAPNVVHINFVPAPDYLLFTSLSYIGIVNYNPMSLNNSYCAPNKIWEYTCYGLPVICNDIPGLKYTIEIAGAGLCVNENETDSIYNGLKEIVDYYDEYSNKAVRFYNSVDNKQIVANILAKL